MTAFDKALDAFRKIAATKLGADPASLQVIPGSADVVGFSDMDLPPLTGFAASSADGQVRGLAAPDGRVVTGFAGAIDHPGVLFDAGASLDAAALAARFAWVLGPDYMLIRTAADWSASTSAPAQLAPTLDRGTLRFFVNQTGDTGVVVAHEVVVTPTGATLTRVAP